MYPSIDYGLGGLLEFLWNIDSIALPRRHTVQKQVQVQSQKSISTWLQEKNAGGKEMAEYSSGITSMSPNTSTDVFIKPQKVKFKWNIHSCMY
jgi:hypothetical protein